MGICWEEVQPLSPRQAVVDGVLIQPLGLMRQGRHLFLGALQLDAVGNGFGRGEFFMDLVMAHTRQVEIGGRCLTGHIGNSWPLDAPEGQAFLAAFLAKGARLSPALARKRPEAVQVVTVEFLEPADHLAWLKPQARLKLVLGQRLRYLPVEQSFTLPMGRAQRRRLTYTLPLNKEPQAFRLLGVDWYNPWPKWERELAAMGEFQADYRKEYLARCPRGWGFPVLRYESGRRSLAFVDALREEDLVDGRPRSGVLWAARLTWQQEMRQAGPKRIQLAQAVHRACPKIAVTLLFACERLEKRVVEI